MVQPQRYGEPQVSQRQHGWWDKSTPRQQPAEAIWSLPPSTPAAGCEVLLQPLPNSTLRRAVTEAGRVNGFTKVLLGSSVSDY